METKKFTSRVYPSGHLLIPYDAFVDLALNTGDEIEVVLRKINKKKTLAKPDVKPKSFMLCKSKQEKLSQLLFKNREGQLTESESQELEKLVFESQLLAIEKARAMLQKANNKSNGTI